MYNMREMTEEESKIYQKSLNNIYQSTGFKINIVHKKEEEDMIKEKKFTTEEGVIADESIDKLYERKDMLSDNLDAIEVRLNALIDEFTSISTEMSSQIKEIRSMLNEL